MHIKPITAVARFILNIVILLVIFYNPSLMQTICGPFTLPPSQRQHLIWFIIILQIFRCFYSLIAELLELIPFLTPLIVFVKQFSSFKYMLILFLKCILIFEQTHRKKYYLHTFLLQLSIIMVAILLDCFRKESITQVGELLLLQGLHRLALVYQLTQTFCPNLILYYSITNFIVFILSQVEAQHNYGFAQSLYVKHDIYRFLFMSLLFFGIISFTQLSSYGFKMLLIFLATVKFYIQSLRSYNQNLFLDTIANLLIVVAIFSVLQLLFIKLPFNIDTLDRIAIFGSQ